MNNPNAKVLIKRRERSESMAGVVHLIGFAVVVAITSVFIYMLVGGANEISLAVFFACMLVCSSLATAFVASVWAVFGLGSYLKRLCCSYLLFAIVGLGRLFGVMLTIPGGTGSSDFFELIMHFLCGIAPVSLAAQIPMGFLRVFWGWQFTAQGKPPANAFLLRDIFVFTLLVAFGFAGPQLAVNMAQTPAWFDPTVSHEQVTAPDGTVTWEEVVVTDQEVIDEEVRNFKRRERNMILSGYAFAAAWGFGISLLSLPIPLVIFGAKDGSIGCSLTVAYAFVAVVLVATIVSCLAPGVFGDALGYIGLFLLSYAAMVSLTFTWSLKQGYCLTSPRRFNRKMSAVKREKR